MSRSLVWPTKTHFYPVGNTPAACLTQDLPPEQPADILLGAGDIRHILFTVHNNLRISDKPRRLDITSCDIDAAILARNILLLAIIVQDHSNDVAWDIYYHVFLDDHNYRILSEQARRLAEISTSLKKWRTSEYGSWLMMSSDDILSELNRHWRLYATFDKVSMGRKQQLRNAFLATNEPDADGPIVNLSAARSAGPLWYWAIHPCAKLFDRYWKTGNLLPGHASRASKGAINPTFVYSLDGERLEPHYGTFPIQAFSLCGVAAQNMSPTESFDAEVLLKGAQTQFGDWCATFRTLHRTSKAAITLRFHVGEALAFGSALTYLASTGDTSPPYYTAPWRAKPIQLAEHALQHAPLSFHVIDTSNLVDQVGLLNLLVVGRSLLKNTEEGPSVLYTETITPTGDDSTGTILSRVCADIPLMGVLLGIAPRAYLSNFTDISNIQEILLSEAPGRNDVSTYHERIAWVDPTSGDRHPRQPHVAFMRDQLVKVLWDIYERILAYENVQGILAKLPRAGKNMMETMKMLNIDQYNRGTFAIFLRAVKDRVIVQDSTWELVVGDMMNRIQKSPPDSVKIGGYQDLASQLWINGVCALTFDVPHGCARIIPPIFRDWDEIPSLVYVVLSVPKTSFRFLQKDISIVGTPTLQMAIESAEGCYHLFGSVHAVAGRLLPVSEASVGPQLEEDRAGWLGANNFLFMCWIPSWIMCHTKSIFSLIVRKSPGTYMRFKPELGEYLEIFTSDMNNAKHVRVLKERPGISAERERRWRAMGNIFAEDYTGPITTNTSASVDGHTLALSALTVKLDVVQPPAVAALQAGATVSQMQSSPCILDVTIGSHTLTCAYPYPVDGRRSRLKVARKSLYVEVIAPTARPLSAGGYSVNLFPVQVHPHVNSWNIHHINLNKLPILDVTPSAALE